ncbi:MAG: hypothetical protein ABI642_15535, partial [Polaromonas sp.]
PHHRPGRMAKTHCHERVQGHCRYQRLNRDEMREVSASSKGCGSGFASLQAEQPSRGEASCTQ